MMLIYLEEDMALNFNKSTGNFGFNMFIGSDDRVENVKFTHR
jgi:hypothetical protein